MSISEGARRVHETWLLELTQIPTAAGHEGRVIEWIEHWVAQRPSLVLERDRYGNMTIRAKEAWGSGRPVYFTGHLDHPAFVVDRIDEPRMLTLEFRGGVMDDYFVNSRVVVHTESGPRGGSILDSAAGERAIFKYFSCELDERVEGVSVGDIATWEFPPAEVIDGVLHTNACDDLAAVAAALAAMDELLEAHERGETVGDVRVLLTLAEEVGFVGAIGACRERTMPSEARVIALENSRSFEDSPIGGGPIVRVGDRMSIFSPSLTGAVAKRAQDIAGGPATPSAQQKASDAPAWKWQRKLMAGGACEATVFCAYGYEATCVCLPLGNYHNMGDLDAVQAGTNTSPPSMGREYIGLADFCGLVDLLVACGRELPEGEHIRDRIETLWNERKFVLGA